MPLQNCEGVVLVRMVIAPAELVQDNAAVLISVSEVITMLFLALMTEGAMGA